MRIARTTARRAPIACTHQSANSLIVLPVPESRTATGVAMTISSHAANVLHIAVFSLAEISDAFVSGRVGVNDRFGLLTVAATKIAMNGGVSSTSESVSKMIAGVSRKMNSIASSNGRRIATIDGSDQPCCRHSNQS